MEDQLGTSVNNHFILKSFLSFSQDPSSLEKRKKIFKQELTS